MGVLYQVSGPFCVLVQGAIVNSPSQPVFLGINQGAGRINVNHYIQKVMSDNAGNQIPADVQGMGKDASISVALSQYDPTVLALLEQRGAIQPGAIGNIGEFLAAGNKTVRLLIPSNEEPWTFFNTVLLPRSKKAGSEYSVQSLEFYAFAPVGSAVSNAKNTLLYSNAAIAFPN